MEFMAYKLRDGTLKDSPSVILERKAEATARRDEVIQIQDAVIWSKGWR